MRPAAFRLLWIVAVGSLVYGALSYFNLRGQMRGFVAAEGVVLEVNNSGDPVVAFKAEDGAHHRLLQRRGLRIATFHKGQTVTVRYLPGEPFYARIEHWSTVYLRALAFMTVGLVLLVPLAAIRFLPHLSGRR
jgi:hypothetical protein